MENGHPEESEWLLTRDYGYYETLQDGSERSPRPEKQRHSIYRILPMPLLLSLAMSVTVATTIYAFKSLACQDRDHCTDEEQKRYAGSIAVANSIAHLVGIFVIGPLQALVKRNERLTLTAWIVSRGLSIGALPTAVLFQSIGVALVGRVFEGAASDNSLHFILNSVYTRTPASTTSRLMGTSFALFMVGMAFGPLFGGVFDDYQISFALGGALLVVSAVYLWTVVPATKQPNTPDPPKAPDEHRSESMLAENSAIRKLFVAFLRPLALYFRHPVVIFYGVSIFLFTAVQSYLFQAIMIHASIAFAFNTAETGWIVSVAAAMSALYLFIILWLLPRLNKAWKATRRGDQSSGSEAEYDEPEPQSSGRSEASTFVLCVSIQAVAILSLKWWASADAFLIAVGLSALGLGMSSFLKSYVAIRVGSGAEAMAALAVMETMGGLASPMVLGAWQALHSSDGTTFIVAAIILGSSVGSFIAGTLLM